MFFIRINNLLNDLKESKFNSFGAQPLNFSMRNPGRVITLGFKKQF